MADNKFAAQHQRGKAQLFVQMQRQKADATPDDGVLRIRALVDASVMVGPSMVAVRSTIAYDDPHMIALIRSNEIPHRVISGAVAPVQAEQKRRGRPQKV